VEAERKWRCRHFTKTSLFEHGFGPRESRGRALRNLRGLASQEKQRKERNIMNEYMNFINGEFVASSGSDRISVTNPSTGATICSVPDSTQHDVDRALDAALKAQPAWAKQPASARG
jgi:delta 1-pyrroline-5-carboxylate dehydrogenase